MAAAAAIMRGQGTHGSSVPEPVAATAAAAMAAACTPCAAGWYQPHAAAARCAACPAGKYAPALPVYLPCPRMHRRRPQHAGVRARHRTGSMPNPVPCAQPEVRSPRIRGGVPCLRARRAPGHLHSCSRRSSRMRGTAATVRVWVWYGRVRARASPLPQIGSSTRCRSCPVGRRIARGLKDLRRVWSGRTARGGGVQGAVACSACPAGRFAAAVSAATACTTCEAGRFQPKAAASRCQLCPRDKYSRRDRSNYAGIVACAPCAPGRMTLAALPRVSCARGSRSPTPSPTPPTMAPTPCPLTIIDGVPTCTVRRRRRQRRLRRPPTPPPTPSPTAAPTPRVAARRCSAEAPRLSLRVGRHVVAADATGGSR